MYWGFDLGLNHGAAARLRRDGTVAWFGYATDRKKNKEGLALHRPDGFIGLDSDNKCIFRGQSIYLPVTKLHKDTREDPLSRPAVKLGWWTDIFQRWLASHWTPIDMVGIEDYAYGAASNVGSFAIAEITGYLKALCWNRSIRMRLHDPKTVKMFAALDGRADADEVAEAAEAWFPDLKGVPRTGFRDSPWHDVGCAAWVARMVWIEERIRDGKLDLASLHAKQRQAFLRTTKVRPTNVLGCEWIDRAQIGEDLAPQWGV